MAGECGEQLADDEANDRIGGAPLRRGLGKPETFTFLGFIFICGKSQRGNFLLLRKTRTDRMRAKLQDVEVQLRRRMHPTQEPGA